MPATLPEHSIVSRPSTWSPPAFFEWPWPEIEQLNPLQLADASGAPRWTTSVRLCADEARLYVHFDCDDNDIWGTYTQRDDPIYEEEVVELFIAPGLETPATYYEFELSPNGVLLDLCVHSPHGDRTDISTLTQWNCPGIQWHAEAHPAQNHWRAALSIPWRSLYALDEAQSSVSLPASWRANFYRIERPRHAEPEFSCWSPTLTEPADFHRAARFGTLHFHPLTGAGA